MKVGIYALGIQTRLAADERRIVEAYDRSADEPAYWSIIDLVGSSNYRLTKGPRLGYLRGENFFTIVRSVIDPCPEVDLLKEMGDAVLLSSGNPRRLFEVVVLVNLVAQQVAILGEGESIPIEIRAGIGYGIAKRLRRPRKDYLGKCLDQLARLLNVRGDRSNIVISEDAYMTCKDVLAEYGFADFGGAQPLSPEQSKGMVETVYFREIAVNRAELTDFQGHFLPWRDALAGAQRS